MLRLHGGVVPGLLEERGAEAHLSVVVPLLFILLPAFLLAVLVDKSNLAVVHLVWHVLFDLVVLVILVVIVDDLDVVLILGYGLVRVL